MLTLNDKAVGPMHKNNVRSCTDVTGFGLLGHMVEMARGSNAELTLYSDKVPIMDGVRDYAEMGLVPGGAYDNKDNFIGDTDIASSLDEVVIDMLFDPQTSGGLLISVPENKASELLIDLYANGVDDAAVIGEVTGKNTKVIVE